MKEILQIRSYIQYHKNDKDFKDKIIEYVNKMKSEKGEEIRARKSMIELEQKETGTKLFPFMCTGDWNQVIILSPDEESAREKYRALHHTKSTEVVEVISLYDNN